jgi:signal transduction histidine kinase/ligand-binding sensor domain-containing protein/CheY-like chemotaxis protein/AraC-like DNA-binding protein
MWFGTATGLIRYDGTTVYRYEHIRGIPNTITDNRINAILEDASNNLWIGTAQGLMIYDPEKDNFIDVDSIAGNTNHLNNRYITTLCADAAGRMWIGTHGQGLNVYDPKTLTFTYLTGRSGHDVVSASDYVTSLYRVGNTMWAGTKGGLNLFNAADMRRSPLPVLDESLASKEITQVSQDAFGNMWLTTVDREVIKLTADRERYLVSKTMLRPRLLNEGEGNLLTLAIDADNNVWTAGENTGLICLMANTGQVIRYDSEEGNARKLPTNSIRYVYVDNTGILWVGTYNRGPYIIDSHAKEFDSYQRSEFIKAGLQGYSVKSLAEDHDGNIWMACDGGGLGMLNTRTGELQVDPELNGKLGTRYLSALLFDEDGNLWIGTWGRGVYKVNLKSRQVENYKIESGGFGDNKVFSLYQDSKKTVWAGSVGSGLFYFDPEAARFTGLNEKIKADYIRKSAYVSYMLEDANGSLWVATLFGLYRLDFRHDNIYDVALYMKNDQPDSIGSYDIQTIYEDRKKDLWFGTGDYGLAVLPYAQRAFTHIKKGDGLISNTIRGVLADGNGNMWISSNMGLTKYDPAANSFRNYTKEDGLSSNEFNANACLIGQNGKFYFGTDRGLVTFFPDSIRNNPVRPVVYLTDLKLNNQSVRIGDDSPLSKHISVTTHIELPYNQRSFAIDFVAINYGQSSRNQYCYKLEEFDDNWNCVGSRTSATYTNIDPGDYVFLVKASNSDGISSDTPARLEITIRQAPWKTWWAFALYGLALVSVVYFLIRIRIERMKIKNQLELERLAREKEHALSESKTQFFTNISHEFRTPLSLITMPLESLIAMGDLPPSARDRLRTARASAEKMTRLVNELMDFNKLENSKLKLHVQPGELVQFITDIASAFHDVASKRNIHFGIHPMIRSLEGWFDRDKLEKIIVNVLSNAFKFTADDGQINVIIHSSDSVTADEQTKARSLKLVIVDNGIGISAEELPFIFDKFYQARSSEKISNPGTGIGLALTKGLVELHRGTIVAESTPARETKFLIHLPIDRASFSDDEIGEMSGYSPRVREINVTGHEPSGAGVSANDDHDRPHILVVEDNDELRKYISLELRPQFTVLEAKDGMEGLDLALERTPDLIISDVLMPLKTGVELCREVKSNLKTSHIPVILLTAKAMVDDQIAGVASGADVYITKPFSIRFLITHVNQIIESRQRLYSRFSQDVYLLPARVTTSEIDKAFLQKAIDLIINNIQDPQLGVDSIADLFNLSRMQAYRKIKALTGKSVVEFIRMVRMKQALKLMDTHQYTLSQIAVETGFNSSSYFTKVFKDEYGKTPSEYLEHA